MLAIDFDKTTEPVSNKAASAVVVPRPDESASAKSAQLARLRLERIEALNRAMQADNELYRSERKAFVDGLAALEKRYY